MKCITKLMPLHAISSSIHDYLANRVTERIQDLDRDSNSLVGVKQCNDYSGLLYKLVNLKFEI